MTQTPVGRTILALAIAAPVAIGWRAVDSALTLQPNSRIWVNGTSNVKNFECKAVNPDITVEATKPDVASAIAAGEKAIGTVDLKVTVATMDCGNGTMNDHMKSALNAKGHPVIEFTLASYALVRSADSVAVTLEGTLTIDGTAKPVTIKAEAKNAGADVLHVTGEYDVSMKTFAVKPPTLFLGTMRVGDKAQVHFDLLLKS